MESTTRGIMSFGFVAVLFVLAGCGSSSGSDAEISGDTAGGADAGSDTGSSGDTGGGGVDYGNTPDAGEDTGEAPDAGPSDAGTLDAGTADAGPDGGLTATCILGGSPVATNAVTVANYSFTPACIKIAKGSKVTWTNTGMASHTVTSDPGGVATFDSGALGTGGTFDFTFPASGSVDYHCIPHESLGMKGTVIVE